MGLSCDCDYGGDEITWHWVEPKDYTTLQTKLRKRCCSCRVLIDIGSTVLQFERSRDTRTVIEERIWGDDMPLAAWYMCETCSDLYLSIVELGYCVDLDDSMRDLAKQA